VHDGEDEYGIGPGGGPDGGDVRVHRGRERGDAMANFDISVAGFAIGGLFLVV
jgi:hypothetical protein